MKIITNHAPKPNPDRSKDWEAIDDDTYGGDENDPIGYGTTKQDAIDDLLEQVEKPR